jgi:hypothetical protein
VRAGAAGHGERPVAIAPTPHFVAREITVSCDKSGAFSVNQFLSKPIEFSENSERIRF